LATSFFITFLLIASLARRSHAHQLRGEAAAPIAIGVAQARNKVLLNAV